MCRGIGLPDIHVRIVTIKTPTYTYIIRSPSLVGQVEASPWPAYMDGYCGGVCVALHALVMTVLAVLLDQVP